MQENSVEDRAKDLEERRPPLVPQESSGRNQNLWPATTEMSQTTLRSPFRNTLTVNTTALEN